MQIETIGHHQLHLIAHELSGKNQWDPFFTIFRFDDKKQDFICVVEKRHAGHQPCNTYEDAIEVARREATQLLESGKI